MSSARASSVAWSEETSQHASTSIASCDACVPRFHRNPVGQAPGERNKLRLRYRVRLQCRRVDRLGYPSPFGLPSRLASSILPPWRRHRSARCAATRRRRPTFRLSMAWFDACCQGPCPRAHCLPSRAAGQRTRLVQPTPAARSHRRRSRHLPNRPAPRGCPPWCRQHRSKSMGLSSRPCPGRARGARASTLRSSGPAARTTCSSCPWQRRCRPCRPPGDRLRE